MRRCKLKTAMMASAAFGCVALLQAVAPGAAEAFSAPTSGDLAYTVYDTAVNELLKGPIGFVAGLGLISFGLYQGVMGQGGVGTAVMSMLGGGAMASADTITDTLGSTM